MNLQTFKDLLSSSSNKLELFTNFKIINNIEFSANELIKLIKSNLSSIDILELFKYSYYQELSEDLKNNLISSIELPSGYFLANINPNLKYIKEFTSNQVFVKKNISLDEILIFCKLLQDSEIDKILQWYPIEHDLVVEIYKSSYSSNKKVKLLTDENDLTSNEKIDILVSIKEEELIAKFLCQNPDYCEKNGITKEDLMNKLIRSKRNRFPDFNRSLDITDFPSEYRECIGSTPVKNTDLVVIDLNSDLEKYRGLDELIILSPQNFSEEKIKKLMKLCEICPNLKVSNKIEGIDGSYFSSGKEYKEAEEWISSVISKLKPEYTKAQKIAIIDNEIGKKIKFTPNQGTEYFNEENARSLWKIINSGFGVCNGISVVEQYILKKLGIDSELVSSFNHTFLRVDDVDITLSDGQSETINGILDSTWNLFAHRFGGMPNLFLISYADARKQDIDSNGIEHHCHDNDKKLHDLTHSLSEKDLRQLFYSVGLTNSDGSFPLEHVMKDLKSLDDRYLGNTKKIISQKLSFLTSHYKDLDLTSSQKDFIKLLFIAFRDTPCLAQNKCSINRVYRKNDPNRKPLLYCYFDLKESGEIFYYLDDNSNSFVQMSKEEFDKNFDCYIKDLNQSKGKKPWEKENKNEKIVQNNSSIDRSDI